jgi:tRNA 2-thiocytidine biosynthesis protein TtcA
MAAVMDSAGSAARSMRVAHYLLRDVNRAIRDYNMIRDGDRIAVAVSGGKDSLALLRLLQLRRASSPTHYELAAVYVTGDATGVTRPHPPLDAWLQDVGIPYRIVEPALAPGETAPLDCQRCTWLRRKAIFFAAEEMGCRVVAYAHHADDVAQTTLLNLLYGGSLATLAPCADYFGGQFRLIRPLIYIPEKELARLARASGFPPPPPNCPRGEQTSRRKIAQMLAMLGRDYITQARPNLIRAGLSGCGARSPVLSPADCAGLRRPANCVRDGHERIGEGAEVNHA